MVFHLPLDELPPPEPDEHEPVCHCRSVYPSQVRHAIRVAGARTVEDLQRLTTACTGCGCCRWDLEDLLADTPAGSGG